MGLRARLISVLAVASLAAVGYSGETAQAAPTHSSSASTTSTTTPTTGVVVKDGGTVTVAIPYLPSEFNPSTPSGENAVTEMIMAQVWPQPFIVNGSLQAVVSSDSHGGPSLFSSSGAELVSVSPQTIVYNLNPKAEWSDGEPITAADFIYNWHEQLAIGNELAGTDPLSGYEDIRSITGSNRGKTVTVVFEKAFADWESLFSNLVPAHIAQKFGWARAFAKFTTTKVISGGPFVIQKVVPNKELILGRNPNYWGNPPQLDHIIFRVETNESSIISGLESGRLDLAQLPPGPNVNALSVNPKLSVQPSLTPVLWQLAFNLANPAVSSVNVREAIANAVDRNQLISNTIGFLTPFNLTSGNRVYASGAPGSQGDDSAYSQVDIAEADQLFSAVGETPSSNGHLRNKAGGSFTLDLVAPTGSTTVDAVESELQSQLLQAGIGLDIHNVLPSKLLGTLLPKGQFEVALAPFVVSPFPSTTSDLYEDPVGPTPLASVFVPVQASSDTVSTAALSKAAGIYVGGNEQEPAAASFGAVTRDVFGFQDPNVLNLYGQAAAQLNASSASGIYNQIDSLLWQDMPTLPLFQMPVILVTRANLVNVSDTQTLVGPLWDAQDWAIRLNTPSTTTSSTP